MFGHLTKLRSTGPSARLRRTRDRPTLLAATIALVWSSGCFVERTGSMIATSFEVKPTYPCEGEEVLLSWSVPADRLATVTTVLTRAPGGILEIPDVAGDGSMSVLPRQPAAPGEIATTDFTFVASVVEADDDAFASSHFAPAIVIGSEAEMPHLENFDFGCNNAPGGGVGWSRRDYDRGQIASTRVRITSVWNLSAFPVAVGMSRGAEVETQTLSAGARSIQFNGEFWGVWSAAPESPESFGRNGCADGGQPGQVLVPPDEEIDVIVPQPSVQLMFQLTCEAP